MDLLELVNLVGNFLQTLLIVVVLIIYITQIFIQMHNTELKDEHKIFLRRIVLSSFP